MELYANQIKFDAVTGEAIPCDNSNLTICASQGVSPRVNFDNIQNAITAVLIIIVNDDWNYIMSTYVKATSTASIAYFYTLTIFGNIVLLNLFVAILLR